MGRLRFSRTLCLTIVFIGMGVCCHTTLAVGSGEKPAENAAKTEKTSDESTARESSAEDASSASPEEPTTQATDEATDKATPETTSEHSGAKKTGNAEKTDTRNADANTGKQKQQDHAKPQGKGKTSEHRGDGVYVPPTIHHEPKPNLHPRVILLDEAGQPVLRSGKPISTMKTCAACHDTDYIAEHSFHVDAGKSERYSASMQSGKRPWDTSPGRFGHWSAISYRFLTPPGQGRFDMGTADWIRTQGWRHVGGGPAFFGAGKTPLANRKLAAKSATPELDGFAQNADGQIVPWDWKASGAVEMNCFLCHTPTPDNAARIDALEKGNFRWANTATLAKSPLVSKDGDAWKYDASLFQEDGSVAAETLHLQKPTSKNCGQCHGRTYFDEAPLTLDYSHSLRSPKSLSAWSTVTKGQFFSPQRLSDSALNLSDKGTLNRPWDVHAAAMLECGDCHFSMNKPGAYDASPRTTPKHLRYDPRRLSVSQYLHRPSHQFAKGNTSQGTVAKHLNGTMRTCSECHNAEASHDWLPYQQVHFAKLSCEACHIPKVYAPALQSLDWTTVSPKGEPNIRWRGVEGDPKKPASLVTGFQPSLLQREDLDGNKRLVPHNLVASWYWVEGEGKEQRPVRLIDLQKAFISEGHYAVTLLKACDANHDGKLSQQERILNTKEKIAAAQECLKRVGIQDAKIQSEVQPYGIHHGVGPAKWATKDCNACHTRTSRLTASFPIAQNIPGGVLPAIVPDSISRLIGTVRPSESGELAYRPDTREAGMYVLGRDRWRWITWLGWFTILGTIAAVSGHALLRIQSHQKLAKTGPQESLTPPGENKTSSSPSKTESKGDLS